MATVTVCFTLDSEADRDILRWLARMPRRSKSAAIRDALREHLGGGGVTLGDVYQAVQELTRRVQAGGVVAGPGQEHDGLPEPPDVAAALAALGRL